jgi:diguanylate cyclase (GGDEF)-like protein
LVGALEAPAVREAFHRRELNALYIDANNFKAVNDSLGHAAGDLLLCGIADRLRHILPEGSLIARLGGDEFVAVVVGADDGNMLARTVAQALAWTHDLGARLVQSSCSVGHAHVIGDVTSPADLIRRADVAMYQAKADKMQEPRQYDEAMDEQMREIALIEQILRDALAQDGFSVVYQPILDLGSGAIEQLEALLRLNTPGRDPIGPDRFIPIAEQAGLIQHIGNHVLRTVCRDMARWPDLLVSVNISPLQLTHAGFVDAMVAITDEHGVRRSSIILELTEGVLINTPAIARRQLDALKAAGFAIHLDDFGAGFSSIGYLSQFPFDGLKIDKSLIHATGGSVESEAMLDSIFAMARAMHLDIVAEGVETEAQRNLLLSKGCGWVQGYLISRPLTPDATVAFLAEEGVRRLRAAGSSLAVDCTAPVCVAVTGVQKSA